MQRSTKISSSLLPRMAFGNSFAERYSPALEHNYESELRYGSHPTNFGCESMLWLLSVQ